MKSRVLFPLLSATVAAAAFAAPTLTASATAATTQAAVSENWAGYVVTPNSGTNDFSAVSGDWTAPKVKCTAGQEAYSADWVGLGGGSDQSEALEQIGTQADCGASGTASYYSWYELVPSAPVKLGIAIHAGDEISARTAVSGDKVSLSISNLTTHKSWSRTLTMTSATPDTSTAEWVAEAPSECAGGASGDCTPLPLANFGTTTFTDAHATAGGHTGTISDSHWTAEAVALEPSSSSLFGGGYGGFRGGYSGYGYGDASGYGYGGYGSDGYGQTGTTSTTTDTANEGAAPTALSAKGTKFSVKYGASVSTGSSGSGEPSTSTQGQGYGSTGSGDGYSGNGYGYSGGGYGDSSPGYGYGYGGGYGYGDSYGGYGYGYGSAYGYGAVGYWGY